MEDPEKHENDAYEVSASEYQMGFVLHKKFTLHILLTVVVNTLAAAIVAGITSQIYPIIAFNLVSFLVGLILYTMMEIIVKMLMIRLFLSVVIKSFGLVFYVAYILLFWIVEATVPNFGFLVDPLNIFYYVTAFILVRLLFTTYIKRAKWIQGGI